MTGVLGDRRARGALLAAGGAAVVLVCTQLLFHGQGGQGTPYAIVFDASIQGLVNALLAAGIVLIYRAHRIINFAQAALGTIGALFAFNFLSVLGWPFPVAFLIGVLVAAGCGLIVDVTFVWRFFNAPRLILTVFTIALLPLIGAIIPNLNLRLPLWPSPDERTQDQLTGRADSLPFDGWAFTVGGMPIRFGFAHVFAIGVSVFALVALAVFLRRTRVGVAVRASAENADRAQLLGISVHKVSMIVWMIAGALSGIAVINQGFVMQQFAFGPTPPELLFLALAAAVLARMQSLPVAVGSAIGLTVLWHAFTFSYPEDSALAWVGILVVIVAGLLLQRGKAGRSEEQEASSWRTTEEPRPIPKEMAEVPGVRIWRRVGIGAVLAAVLLYPWVATPRQIEIGGNTMIIGMVLISLVVLTGWAGQVSLGQFAFVAVGAVLGGAATSTLGISFWFAILLVPAATAALTVLIGIPALRIKGLFLAVATFALALAVQAAMFEERYLGWLLPDRVDRPEIFMLDFDDGRSFYYLTLASLILVMVVVTVLRRSRVGRVLIGLRENENNMRSFGVDPVRMRLLAFAISGAICGFAGLLLAHHARALAPADFAAEFSLFAFLYAVVGGVGSIAGVLIGAVYVTIVTGGFLTNELWVLLVGPVLLVTILYLAPGGITQIAMSVRDGILRIVAQRRQMIVPSLFADVDPEVLERRLIPLAEPLSGGGVEALPADRLYRQESELYGTRGRLVAGGRRRAEDEKAALGAAARSAEEDEGAATPPAETTATGRET